MSYHVQELGSIDVKGKTVTVMGLGSIGSAVADRLARMGVNLRVIDRDRVYQEDVHHLSLFSNEHVSKFKAKEAKKILEGLCSDIQVKAFHEDIVENNAYLVAADVVVECSGNLPTALLVDKAAKKTPLVYARIQGVNAVVHVATDTRLKEVTGFLEKQVMNPKAPVLGSASTLVASLVVNKVLMLLAGIKVEKSALIVDTWKGSIEKTVVRKDTKKK